VVVCQVEWEKRLLVAWDRVPVVCFLHPAVLCCCPRQAEWRVLPQHSQCVLPQHSQCVLPQHSQCVLLQHSHSRVLQFCFSNKFSSVTAKEVFFLIAKDRCGCVCVGGCVCVS